MSNPCNLYEYWSWWALSLNEKLHNTILIWFHQTMKENQHELVEICSISKNAGKTPGKQKVIVAVRPPSISSNTPPIHLIHSNKLELIMKLYYLYSNHQSPTYSLNAQRFAKFSSNHPSFPKTCWTPLQLYEYMRWYQYFYIKSWDLIYIFVFWKSDSNRRKINIHQVSFHRVLGGWFSCFVSHMLDPPPTLWIHAIM